MANIIKKGLEVGNDFFEFNVIPTGGTTGQVLIKNTDANYDLKWANGGSGGTTDYNSLENKPIINQDLNISFNPVINSYYRHIGSSLIGTQIAIGNTFSSSTPLWFNIDYPTSTLKVYCQSLKAAGKFEDGAYSFMTETSDNNFITIMDLEAQEMGTGFAMLVTSGDFIWFSDNNDFGEEGAYNAGWQVNVEVFGQINLDSHGRWYAPNGYTFTVATFNSNTPQTEWNSIWVSRLEFYPSQLIAGTISTGTIYKCIDSTPTYVALTTDADLKNLKNYFPGEGIKFISKPAGTKWNLGDPFSGEKIYFDTAYPVDLSIFNLTSSMDFLVGTQGILLTLYDISKNFSSSTTGLCIGILNGYGTDILYSEAAFTSSDTGNVTVGWQNLASDNSYTVVSVPEGYNREVLYINDNIDGWNGAWVSKQAFDTSVVTDNYIAINEDTVALKLDIPDFGKGLKVKSNKESTLLLADSTTLNQSMYFNYFEKPLVMEDFTQYTVANPLITIHVNATTPYDASLYFRDLSSEFGQDVYGLSWGGTAWIYIWGPNVSMWNDPSVIYPMPLSIFGGDYTITSINSTYNGKLFGSSPFIATTKAEVILDSAENVSNPNLLINSDFRINQRGLTTYTQTSTSANKYTVDRWYMGVIESGASITCNPLSNGINVSKSATTTGGYFLLNQKLEDFSKLRGKTITLSCKFNGNNGSFRLRADDNVGTYYTSTITSESGTTSTTFTVADSAARLRVIVQDLTTSAMSVNIEWIKLEVGSVATLYSPPLIAEELSKCQRYYHKIAIHGGATSASTGTQIYPAFPIASTLRTNPTIVIKTYPAIRGGGISSYTLTSSDTISTNAIYSSVIRLGITLSTSQLTGGTIYAFANGLIELDAEMY